MAAAVEGAQVDFDNASEIEGRYFVELVTGQVAKNMIQAFFFDLQAATGEPRASGRSRDVQPTKMVVLGAGMMGAAIAYVSAKAGVEVVLKDVSQEAAERGKGYSEKLVAKAVERGRSTQEDGDALLARITPTTDPGGRRRRRARDRGGVRGSGGQEQVMAEIEPHLAPDALLGSNTSTLPITGLAENVSRPADFIGLHFFSPVDKMPLLEIIRGEQTSDETVYRALDVAKLIRKTPIVVNDSRGFFTSRVIGTFINEGIAMLAEGVPAATIEQASSQAGYPAPVLQLSDELNMKLMRKIRNAAKAAAEGGASGWDGHPAEAVIDRMLDEFDRPGRLEGARLLRVRGRQAHRPVAGAARRVPAGRRPVADLAARPRGADDVHRVDRDRQVPRRGRDRVGRRRQHRLDLRHRLPGLDRRRAAVHQRIRAAVLAGRLRRPRARARRPVRRALRAARVAGRAGRARRDVHRRAATLVAAGRWMRYPQPRSSKPSIQ